MGTWSVVISAILVTELQVKVCSLFLSKGFSGDLKIK